MNLRPLAEQFVECELGNGRLASFWFDSWCSLGPLINLFGEHGPRELRLPLHSPVAAACNERGWSLPLQHLHRQDLSKISCPQPLCHPPLLKLTCITRRSKVKSSNLSPHLIHGMLLGREPAKRLGLPQYGSKGLHRSMHLLCG